MASVAVIYIFDCQDVIGNINKLYTLYFFPVPLVPLFSKNNATHKKFREYFTKGNQINITINILH